jgi:hypothetical protein
VRGVGGWWFDFYVRCSRSVKILIFILGSLSVVFFVAAAKPKRGLTAAGGQRCRFCVVAGKTDRV